MSISEQVKHLKELSDTAKANVYSFEALSQSLRQAADTIESLSAKLKAENCEAGDMISRKKLIKELFCIMPYQFGAQAMDWFRELIDGQPKASAADCGGGWITDRIPTREECNGYKKEFAVTVDANGIKTLVMDFSYETVRGKEVSRWKWRDRISPWEVIAWQPLPEPYHEP